MKYKSLQLLMSKDGKSFIDPVSKLPVPTIKSCPINPRYLVSIHGHVFDSFNEYEKLNPYAVKGHYFVDIEFPNNKKSVPFLLGEFVLSTFVETYKIGDRYDYKSKSKRCKLANLRHIPQPNPRVYPESELINWDCYNKANYANNRVLGLNAASFTITAIDVYECLIRSNFRCAYCGESLITVQKWHLDHIEPISKGGMNNRENITPACVECNLMKHSLMAETFFAKVLKIAHYSNLQNTKSYHLLDFSSDVIASFRRVYIVPSEILEP